MHDIDRTYEAEGFEFGVDGVGEAEYGEGEFGEGEFGEADYEEGDYGEGEADFEFAQERFDSEADQESPFDEVEEMELAAELLSVSNEEELDQFLGNFLRKVGRTVGKAVRSPVGRALGGILKGAVKKALPIAGGAVGSMFGGPLGATIGSRLASNAGQAFGLEAEGMSQEDQEFEAARSYVRFAGTAAKNAALAMPTVPPQIAARKAVIMSARRHAPGLLAARPSYYPAKGVPRGTIGSGRWFRIRRNNRTYIVLQGA